MTSASRRPLPSSHLSFEAFFSAYFGSSQWRTLRKALQAPKQSCALINRYCSKSTENLFPSHEFRQLDGLSTSNMIVMEYIDSSTVHDIPRPINFSHYPMCASSLLAVLALDIQPNDRILDMCASPGGKSLAILQQFNDTNHLTSNEVSNERYGRLIHTLKSHIPSDLFHKQVRATNFDGTRQHGWTTTFDKILVDAPCSSERHLVNSSSTHLWSVKRSKANARRQIELLRAAFRCVNPKTGSIVYSTCSLSPFENDLVIEQFLKTMSNRVQIHKLTFPFGHETEYGWLVLPEPWGPFYVCVLHVRQSTEETIEWRFHHDSSSDESEEEEEEEKGA